MINRTTTTTTGPRASAARTIGPIERKAPMYGRTSATPANTASASRVWHTARHQEDERKDRNEQARDQLPADVSADDRLQIHHDAGKADMVRARNDREKTATKPVAVDHDVEREKDGARAVRSDLEDAHREG